MQQHSLAEPGTAQGGTQCPAQHGVTQPQRHIQPVALWASIRVWGCHWGVVRLCVGVFGSVGSA